MPKCYEVFDNLERQVYCRVVELADIPPCLGGSESFSSNKNPALRGMRNAATKNVGSNPTSTANLNNYEK